VGKPLKAALKGAQPPAQQGLLDMDSVNFMILAAAMPY
jgi:hypothetical protein